MTNALYAYVPLDTATTSPLFTKGKAYAVRDYIGLDVGHLYIETDRRSLREVISIENDGSHLFGDSWWLLSVPEGETPDPIAHRYYHVAMPPKPTTVVLRRYVNGVLGDAKTQHHWLSREMDKYPLHYTIKKLLDAGTLPKDTLALTLEWPHVSVNDPARIAYTRNIEHGIADRQTVTSLGKYLRRHFRLADHNIRDLCAQALGGAVKLTNDLEQMIDIVQEGPSSCMTDDFDYEHPYNVYAPKYGWGMAYREEGDNYVARALTFENGEHKCFVRSYGEGGTDPAIDGALRAMGYEKRGSWPAGARLDKIEVGGGEYVMPYIDGGLDKASHCGDHFVLDPCGPISAENTNGLAEVEPAHTCECCGDDIRDYEDVRWVGIDDDESVCESCLDYNYLYVYGRNGDQYYVNGDRCDVIEVDGDPYDQDYLSDNDIVETEDGEYAKVEDTGYVYRKGLYRINDMEHYDFVDLRYSVDGDPYDSGYASVDDCTELRDGSYVHNSRTDIVETHDGFALHADLSDDERHEHGLPVSPVTPDGQVKLPLHELRA